MIKPDTLRFIADVAQNNDRDWFAENKSRYEVAKHNVLELVELLIPRLAAIDSDFPADTPSKKCLLRIYRDVRFSKNKEPYKTNYGISFDIKNGAMPQPGYYLHIQPGQCFLAGGFWMPEASVLKRIREEIDYNGQDLLSILQAPAFKERFSLSEENKLKTTPKGYDAAHPQIDLLRLKSFVAVSNLDEQLFRTGDIVEEVSASFATLYPFMQFLKNAVAQ